MRRKEHNCARVLTVAGLVAFAGYLAWRVAFSLDGSPMWLSLPALAVELLGFAGAALLAWALWPSPLAPQSNAGARAANDVDVDQHDAVDVVVRVDRQPTRDVRATLLALRGTHRVADVVVVDVSARPEVAALANEFESIYAATDPDDCNGVRVALAAVGTSRFLLIEAGDIATPDIVDRLGVHLVDPRVAIVQGLGTSVPLDSPEHGPDGRHELTFERAALNPALGRRGRAIWSGSGSLIRTVAMREVQIGNESALTAHWSTGVALLASGWHVVAPADVVVIAHRPLIEADAVAADRAERARASRSLVFGAHGALRGEDLGGTLRAAVLAWAVRPLSGQRRLLFLAVLCAALLSGSVPFHVDTMALIGGWLPGFVYTSLGLALLSGWTLRPGDRTRWSLRWIGAAFAGQDARSHGLIVAVVALSVVLVVRGVSDRVTHTLDGLPPESLMLLLIVSLWSLAMSLDLLRVLARRSQSRQVSRMVAALPATLGERAVNIVDLTPLGAGLISHTGATLNERMTLDTVITTRSGVTTMRVPCVVRNSTKSAAGEYRVGVEFGATDSAVANALAELCTVEPMWEHLGAIPGHSPADAARVLYLSEPIDDRPTRQLAVRAVAMLALVAAVASAAPGDVSAAPARVHSLSGRVQEAPEPVAPGPLGEAGDPPIDSTWVSGSLVDTDEPLPTTEPVVVESAPALGVAGVEVVAVCSLDAGIDGVWGTLDDDWSDPVATFTDEDGYYVLELVGDACWAAVAPPEGYVADHPVDDVGPVPQPLDVSGSTAERSLVVARRPTVIAARFDEVTPPPLTAVRSGVVDRVDSRRELPAPPPSFVPAPVSSSSDLRGLVSVFAAFLAASLLLGLARTRHSSASPDLAMRYPMARSDRG